MKIAQYFGLKNLKFEVKSNNWNLNKILKHIQSVQENSKCCYEDNWIGKAYYICKESWTTLWINHYQEVIDGDISLINKYNSLRIVTGKASKNMHILDTLLAEVKASISLLKANEKEIESISNLISIINPHEIFLDEYVSKNNKLFE